LEGLEEERAVIFLLGCLLLGYGIGMLYCVIRDMKAEERKMREFLDKHNAR
jgi:hypothetical protein